MSDTNALRDFFAAWSEPTADGCAARIAAAVGNSLYYADPHAPEPVTSVEGFHEFVAEFSQKMPGARADLIEPADIHHGHARCNVRFDFGGGKSMVGQYFADLDTDGRVLRMVGFPGKGAE